jgi:hypothetical protein
MLAAYTRLLPLGLLGPAIEVLGAALPVVSIARFEGPAQYLTRMMRLMLMYAGRGSETDDVDSYAT